MIAPGFRADPAKFAMALDLTRIMFPYLVFISLVALQGGILNSLDRFAAAAITPVLLNIFLIGALVGVRPLTGEALGLGGDGVGRRAIPMADGVVLARRHAAVRCRCRASRPNCGGS